MDGTRRRQAGYSDVAVSAGNTGALMAMAKFHLKTMAGIDRPAIAALWPTLRGESIVLDVGATIGADAKHLVDMAVMGGAMARVLFDLERPTVGLLNIGVEEAKGLEPVREAGQILRQAARPDLDYMGFVEGDDIGKGTVDVVVTEGFAGNIALKTARGNRQTACRIFARGDEPDALRQDRILVCAQSVRGREGQDGSSKSQWWRVPRPQWGCDQEFTGPPILRGSRRPSISATTWYDTSYTFTFPRCSVNIRS